VLKLFPQAVSGVVVLLTANAALAYTAHLVARRFFAAEASPVRWAAAGTVFVALVLLVTQALSPLALYARLPVTLSCLVVAALAHAVWGQHRDVVAEVACLQQWLRLVVASRGAVLLCAAAVAVFLAIARGLVMPPLSWDSVMYHLFLAARYVQLHRLAGFDGPPMMDHYSHFPINGEIMAAWALLPFGTDLLVGLVSLPFLALGAVALYGLCREVGAQWDEASLAVCLVCFSPFLFAYVTTQDVDIQVFAALMCGALFVLRYLRAQRAACAVAACTAIGVAAGTKHTALGLSAMLLLTLVLAVVLHYVPRRQWRPMVATLGCGLLFAAAVGSRTYGANWWDTGNPIYPLDLTVGGHQILPGSPYTDMIAEGNGVGTRREDLAQFLTVFNYYPTWRLPTSGGPKFPLLLLLALGSVIWATRDPQRWPVLLLAAYGLVGVCVFYLPGGGFPALARRLWPGAANRFLADPFALLVAAAMPAIGQLRARMPALLGILAGFTLWDIMVANTTVTPSFPLVVGAAALAIPAALAVPWRRWLSHVPVMVPAGGLTVIAVVLAALLQQARDGSRWVRYKESTDVSWIPREFVDGWRYCDQPDHPRAIALAAGWEYRGQNFFFYPLLGRRLQNTVVHIPVRGAEGWPPHGPTDPNAATAWMDDIRHAQVDTVFVEKPWPIEESWMRDHPDTFSLLKAEDGFKIYAVTAR
jgi:hypothetical protein